MRSLVSLLVVTAAALASLVGAQRCEDGCVRLPPLSFPPALTAGYGNSLTLYQPSASAPAQCCVASGNLPGAICEIQGGSPSRSVCHWTRQADGVTYTLQVPSGVPAIESMSLAGTPGEWLNGYSPDSTRQRGTVVSVLGPIYCAEPSVSCRTRNGAELTLASMAADTQ